MPDPVKAGILLNIAVKERSRAPMKPISTTTITLEGGIKVENRIHVTHRQITVISRESWDDACAEVQADLPWTTRRANLLIEGVDLHDTTGNYLIIGDLILEVTGETKPCNRMEEAHQGLQAALAPNWRGGITCRVVQGGQISIGDEVQVTISNRKQESFM